MIEVTNLTKRFGHVTAIEDISFSVGAGEILGFLGPNGAGKSTTMKMITGFLAPTGGSIVVEGHAIGTATIAAQRQIGYLPEGAPCYEDMNPAQFLDFIAEIRGFTGDEKRVRAEAVIRTMGLASVLGQKIETLSKGFKRRVGLAQALIHDPKILILDEPTDGLDPNQKHQVREMIRGLSKEKIVIISTHILEEVTAVCTRAIIIADGRIVSDCTPSELEAQSKYHQAVTVHLTSDQQDLQDVRAALLGVDGVRDVAIDDAGDTLTVFPEGHAAIFGAVNQLIGEKALDVDAVYMERGRLDEVFRSVTEGAAS